MKGGEAKKKKKKKKIFFFFFFFFCKIGNFLSGIGKKNILFGIGNGAEFRPQNRVIESPVYQGLIPFLAITIMSNNLCKQFGPRSGSPFCLPYSEERFF